MGPIARIERLDYTTFLTDAVTGAPIAIMSANLLSSMRTGASPGVATKYLQSSNASTIGIVGAGVIGRSCLMALAETVRHKESALVYDISLERSNAFCEEMSKRIALNVHSVNSVVRFKSC